MMTKISKILTIDSNNNHLDEKIQEKILDSDFDIKFDFKKHIQANMLRRMSPVIRKGVGAAMELNLNQDSKLDAIVVGTGLGCLKDSIRFIDQYKDNPEGLVSPTAFIQSTHNTIAGQIGLMQGNHCYNMTYVQNGLSFECAQIDALCQLDGNGKVLLGCSEENVPILNELASLFGQNAGMVSEAATFMVLSNDEGEVEMELSETILFESQQSNLEFIDFSDRSLILYGRSDILEDKIDHYEIIDLRYDVYSGRYLTNVTFGIHLAFDLLMNGNQLSERQDFDEVVVVNNYQNLKFGITRLRRK